MTVLSYPQLNAMRRRVRTESDAPGLLSEIKFLRARYEQEVHTTIEGFDGSHSLAYWSEFFKLHPSLRTNEVRARLAYARDTKVEFDLSSQLNEKVK
jgi:hypothetical protein